MISTERTELPVFKFFLLKSENYLIIIFDLKKSRRVIKCFSLMVIKIAYTNRDDAMEEMSLIEN